jgi:hypothetical protein
MAGMVFMKNSFILHNNDLLLNNNLCHELNENEKNTGHSAIRSDNFLNNFAHEQLCDEFPSLDLFNHYIDDKYQYPAKRGALRWESENPNNLYGKSHDFNNPEVSFSVNEMPPIWKQFLLELGSPEYKSFIDNLHGTGETLKMYGNFWCSFCEPLGESLDNYNYIGKSILAGDGNYGKNPDEIAKEDLLLSGFYSIREGKYIQNGLVAPCMKPHIGSDNKRISIVYYLNSEKEWKEEYGGRTVFYYVDKKTGWDPRDNPYESAKHPIQLKPEMAGNVTVMFKNSVGCWHTIEDIKVPSKTIIRKNFILVVHI